jgi:hypothetical protein
MRNAIIAVVLIVVIIGAVVFAVMRTKGGTGGAKGEILAKVITVMDVDTKQKVQVVARDLVKYQVDPETNRYIDPKTGHKLADITTCRACKKDIPVAPFRTTDMPEEREKQRNSYKCPECGGSP